MRALLACLLWWASGVIAATIEVRDDIGRPVTLQGPAQRIVSLAPFLTELAFSAGLGPKVVGTSAHSDYPPQARALPQVASAAGLSLEGIAALRPDLVLAWRDSIRDADLERLAALRIPVFVAQAHALDDPPRLLEAIARLGDGDARAGSEYRTRLRELRARHGGRTAVPVLVEIWHQPLTTLAGRHWVNEALAACGARNAFADLPGIAPVVPWELVMAREPAAIVGAGSAPDEAAFRAQWAARGTLAAVRGGRLVFVHGDLIQRPTLRLAEGVGRLCAGIDAAREQGLQRR